MCYILYGAVNLETNADSNVDVSDENYSFKPCSRKEFKKMINTQGFNYTITGGHCDCSTAVGRHDYDASELKELAEFILNMRNNHDIKSVFFCKKWISDSLLGWRVFNVDDIDLVKFLADVKRQQVYEIIL
jgi:hypothetical protein